VGSSARAPAGNGLSGSRGLAGITSLEAAPVGSTDGASASTRWLPDCEEEPEDALVKREAGALAEADAGRVVVRGTSGDDRIEARLTWLAFPDEAS
jgi:hypothetical protein